jgi:hypothetical protein
MIEPVVKARIEDTGDLHSASVTMIGTSIRRIRLTSGEAQGSGSRGVPPLGESGSGNVPVLR